MCIIRLFLLFITGLGLLSPLAHADVQDSTIFVENKGKNPLQIIVNNDPAIKFSLEAGMITPLVQTEDKGRKLGIKNIKYNELINLKITDASAKLGALTGQRSIPMDVASDLQKALGPDGLKSYKGEIIYRIIPGGYSGFTVELLQPKK